MDKEEWEIKNKIYLMKEKKKKLENGLNMLSQSIKERDSVNIFGRLKNESFFNYCTSIFILILLRLDKIVGYYYKRYDINKSVRNIKKEIITLTQEIEDYEYKL